MSSLKKRAAHGVFWHGLQAALQQVLGFTIGILLARRLDPADYGLVAMVAIFVQIANTVIDGGLSISLIQKKDATDQDASSMFHFNLLASIIFYAVLWFCADLIAGFFAEPELVVLIKIIALSLIISAFGQSHLAMMKKKLNYRPIFVSSAASGLIGGGVGLALAYSGFGVWALVAQSLTVSTIRSGYLWAVSTWRPKLVFSMASVRSLFAFGGVILFTRLLESLFLNLYGLVIGRVYTADDLAFYRRGYTFPSLVSMLFSNTFSQVAFPVMSEIQNDTNKMKSAFRQMLLVMLSLLWPLLILLFVVADSLVYVLLTEKWMPSVPYMRVTCLMLALKPWGTMNLQILTAKGRSQVYLKVSIASKILTAVNIVLTYRHGIIYMLYGQLVVAFAELCLKSYYGGGIIRYSLIEQIKDAMPIILSVAVAGLVAFTSGQLFEQARLPSLLAQGLTGASVYLLLMFGTGFISMKSIFSSIKVIRAKAGRHGQSY